MKTKSTYFCSYSIGENPYEEVVQVCSMYGSRILLIGGTKGLNAGKKRLEEVLRDSELEIADTVLYGHDCTYEGIDKWAAYAREIKVDMI